MTEEVEIYEVQEEAPLVQVHILTNIFLES